MNINAKYMGHALLLGMVFLLTACQQPLQTPSEGGTTKTVVETFTGLELCDDGTLNCYVNFPENPAMEQIIKDPVNAYQNCMQSCLIDNGCTAAGNINPFTFTAAQDYFRRNQVQPVCTNQTQNDACHEKCAVILENGGGIGFESDPIAIPENAKAVTVKIKSCLTNRPNHFQFKGPNMGTRKLHQGQYKAKLSNGWFSGKEVTLPHQVGMGPDCSDERKGKVLVTFIPYKKQEPFAVNSDIAVDTIAFSDAVPDKIDMVWKGPHLTSAQIPQELMGELDLSQMSWLLKSIDTDNPSAQYNISTFAHDFAYAANGRAYGDSIVYFSPILTTNIDMDFTMVLFVKAQE